MRRKGLGKGLGMGYKNLVPRDSYIHSLSARGVRDDKGLSRCNIRPVTRLNAKKKFFRKGKTFIGIGGFKFTKKYVETPSGLQILLQIPEGSGIVKKSRKKPEYHPPRKRKIVGARTLEGAGAGFVAGLGAGGFIGMMAGVPIGAFAGNIIGKKETGQKIKLKDLFKVN